MYYSSLLHCKQYNIIYGYIFFLNIYIINNIYIYKNYSMLKLNSNFITNYLIIRSIK